MPWLNRFNYLLAYFNVSAILNQKYDPHFPLQHQQKDLRLALQLGDKVEQPLYVAAATNEVSTESWPLFPHPTPYLQHQQKDLRLALQLGDKVEQPLYVVCPVHYVCTNFRIVFLMKRSFNYPLKTGYFSKQ